MVLLLLVASVWFCYRGPARALHGGGFDFQAPYVSSVRFAHGLDPYATSDYEASWRSIGSSTGMTRSSWFQRSVYPPTTFPWMLPLAMLSWKHSLVLLELISVLLYAHVLYLLSHEIEGGWESWRRVGFLAFGLALSPVQTGLSVGNPSILVFLLCIYSLLWSRTGSARGPWGSGILLGLSLCLKPTVGLVLLGYLLLARKWKPIFVGAGVAAVTGVFALAWMRRFPGWLQEYRGNVAWLFGPTGSNSFTATNGNRFDILNLQVPFYELTRSNLGANILSWALVLVLFCGWLALVRRNPLLQERWETIGSLLLMGLLPIYERNYNAGFVVIAILWGFQRFGTRLGKLLLLIGTILLFPGEALLRNLGHRWPLLARPSFFMDFVVFPQLTWALLGIIVVLLWGMKTDSQVNPGAH